MRYELAIFDMDGTILNTLEDLTAAANYALTAHGYPTRSLDEIRNFVGNGIRKTVERAVPAGTDDTSVEQVYKSFCSYYEVHNKDNTKPYPGVCELIKVLKDAGCKTAVVSNKAHAAVLELVDEFFDGLFDVAIGEMPGVNRKPAPDSVFSVLDKLNIPGAQAVYIGDSDVDAATARNSGLDLIAVDWGFKSRAFLEEIGADTIVSTPYEIENLILSD